MIPKNIYPAILILLGIVVLPVSSFGTVTLFQQDFDSTPADTSQTIYAGNSNAGGTSPTVAADPVSSGDMSGDGLKFTGSSANSCIAANFQAVTLSNPGDYITISYTYVAMVNPAGSGTNRIGLFNSGGTLLNGNMFGTAGQSSDDVGYYVAKNLISPLPANDVAFQEVSASAGGLPNPSSTTIAQGNSGITGVDTSVHTVSLTLSLLSDGDMDMTYIYDGYSESTTIVGSGLLTTTFDEFMLAPGAGSSTTMYVDDITVVSNIPEPASFAIMASLVALGVVCVRGRFRGGRRVA